MYIFLGYCKQMGAKNPPNPNLVGVTASYSDFLSLEFNLNVSQP